MYQHFLPKYFYDIVMYISKVFDVVLPWYKQK